MTADSQRPTIGLVLRCDRLLREYGFKRISVPTRFGRVDRMFMGQVGDQPVAVLYGRFNGTKTPSADIDYQQNQAAFAALGVSYIVGTYLVGSVTESIRAGDVCVPSDFIGVGGYRLSMHEPGQTFSNVDMFSPFCPRLRTLVLDSAREVSAKSRFEGTYICFHGYPRIETEAELKLYASWGGTVVGQTLDPEATLARQMHCHYAALCVPVDDHVLRRDFVSDPGGARARINDVKGEGREEMQNILEHALRRAPEMLSVACTCDHRPRPEKDYFAPLPHWETGFD